MFGALLQSFVRRRVAGSRGHVHRIRKNPARRRIRSDMPKSPQSREKASKTQEKRAAPGVRPYTDADRLVDLMATHVSWKELCGKRPKRPGLARGYVRWNEDSVRRNTRGKSADRSIVAEVHGGHAGQAGDGEASFRDSGGPHLFRLIQAELL